MREAEIAARLAAAWGLRLGEALPGATCSLVLSAWDDQGREAVLKVPEPATEEIEAAPTLRAFSEHGGVAVWRVDEETGAVLLPRLRPGHTLAEASLSETEKVDVCAEVILGLRTALPRPATMRLEAWFQELDPDEDALARDASRVASHLFATTERTVLLHGDLHHFNLLADGERWVAIDPKGLVGDPAHEVSAFMRNVVGDNPGPETMSLRIRRFAERLGDPPDRLWGWAFAQTVLSGQWTNDPDHHGRAWRAAAQALAECRFEFWPD
jgi:streptomycin 6-kinase